MTPTPAPLLELALHARPPLSSQDTARSARCWYGQPPLGGRQLHARVPRQYRVRPKIVDLGAVPGHSTRQCVTPFARSRRFNRLVNPSRVAARMPGPTAPVGRTRAVEPTISPSERLLWLILRRVWPGWRDARILIKPATVDRWHRDGFYRCWRRRLRRLGRPRIDSQCRDLIRQMAVENRLWGAPRIQWRVTQAGDHHLKRTASRC